MDRKRAEEEAYIAGRERSVAEPLAAVEQSKLEQLGADEVEPWSSGRMLAELDKILETLYPRPKPPRLGKSDVAW
ncbi:MAG TPA: hypothetical protein VIY49_27790 [Bryobacteraceae bacterium]